ncbi:hypothetical protein Sjap_007574 [Stephania japonica]|uniref:Protein kinase domain-containing protein n=1 Tax=Stephania japonica TaxID=461633 RepID=A0AAP0JQ34_9MAGN
MVREILILRKLDHPNVLKWEGLVTSTMSHSLYLIFEYVEHDLASLAAQPEVNFTMPQVKSYMHQLLLGLEHYHSRGLLHHDIKMSNLFINDRGVLKIAEFGSATFFGHNFKYPITSYAINLWYQPPELLLGETYYGVGVDLWSAGCVLGELLFGKPIMPGRTKVEQLLRIFELCGSPSEEYWNRSKLPYATLFKPQRPYKRRIAESFNNFPPSLLQLIETLLAIDPAERKSATAALMSEFFTPELYAPYPSRIPHFSPSKEVDVKQCKAKARRKGEAVMKGQKARAISAPNGNAELILSMQKGQMQPNFKSWGEKFDPHREGVASGFPIDLPRQSQAVEETEKGQREHNNKASLFGILTYQTRWTESSRNQDHAPNMSSGDNLSTLPSLMAATNLLADSSGGKPGSSQPVATKFINRWLPGPFREVSECNRKQEMERQAQGSSSSNQNEDDSINSWDQILPGNDSKVNKIFYGGPLFTPPAMSNLDQLFKKYSPLIQDYAREAQLDEKLRKSKLEGTK